MSTNAEVPGQGLSDTVYLGAETRSMVSTEESPGPAGSGDSGFLIRQFDFVRVRDSAVQYKYCSCREAYWIKVDSNNVEADVTGGEKTPEALTMRHAERLPFEDEKRLAISSRIHV